MFLGGLVIVGSIASAAAVSATTEVIVDTHHWWGRVTMVIGAWLVGVLAAARPRLARLHGCQQPSRRGDPDHPGWPGVAGSHHTDRRDREHSGRRLRRKVSGCGCRVRTQPQLSTITSRPSGRINVSGPRRRLRRRRAPRMWRALSQQIDHDVGDEVEAPGGVPHHRKRCLSLLSGSNHLPMATAGSPGRRARAITVSSQKCVPSGESHTSR